MPQKHNMSSVERVVFPAIMLVAQQALHALRIKLVVESWQAYETLSGPWLHTVFRVVFSASLVTGKVQLQPL